MAFPNFTCPLSLRRLLPPRLPQNLNGFQAAHVIGHSLWSRAIDEKNWLNSVKFTQAKRWFGCSALSVTLLASCGSELENQSTNDASQNKSLRPLQTSEAPSDRDNSEHKVASRAYEEAVDSHSKRLSKADLERSIAGAKFRPKESSSLASTLIFNDSNKVIYSSYSAGLVYSERYYRIENDSICVYDDKLFRHQLECISFFFVKDELFRLDFESSLGDNAGVLYLRQPNSRNTRIPGTRGIPGEFRGHDT